MNINEPPARIGMHLSEVDTPALLIDLDAFEDNLQRMAENLTGRKARLRPHAKTHKSPVIALRQMALGAVGVCCQKVSEAEAMVYGGVPDVLVTNEIVGRPKIERLVSLAKQARVGVCADHPLQVAAYGAVAQAMEVQLDVLVELDAGGGRCGVGSGQPVLDLAQKIVNTPMLRFAGLQAYHGRAQHLRTVEERREAIAIAVSRVHETTSLLSSKGISCERVTGAGTGTYLLEAASSVYNELQAGSYIFMDADYARNLDENGKPTAGFRHSLFVLATVMSRPTEGRAVLDVGHKGVSVDSGMPLVDGMPGVECVGTSDEHASLLLKSPQPGLKVSAKVKLIPGHCDPTVNLYDWYVCVRNDRVEAMWPITARGAMR